MPAKRLTPDETEARAKWWISSRAYFDGGIGQSERLPRHLNRQNMYEVPSELYRHFEEQKREIEEQKKVVEEIRRNEAERKSTYDKMVKFLERMNVEPVREANTGPIFVNQHFGISDLSEPRSMQGGPSSFQTHPNSSSFFNIGTPTNWQTPMQSQPGPSNWHSQMPAQSATPYWQPAFPSHPGTYNWQSPIPSHMGNTNLQPPIERHHVAPDIFNQNILNRGKREQRPSYYKQSPYMEQPPTTILPKQRGNKKKNNVTKANLSPLNLGNAFADENVGGDDVVFLGGRFTGNYLVYENVDPQKVRREHYITLQEFLNIPRSVYLDCYMKGYSVPVTFWQQLVPHLCPPDYDSGTPMGWLSGEVFDESLLDGALIHFQSPSIDEQGLSERNVMVRSIDDNPVVLDLTFSQANTGFIESDYGCPGISAINLDDYHTGSPSLPVPCPPPTPSSPFSLLPLPKRMIAETDPTQREEALTETGQNSVPVPETALTVCTMRLRGQLHTILEDMDRYQMPVWRCLKPFMSCGM
ncbi:hypothetical protein Tco_0214292 [Tanacetum coccineum]